MSGLRRLPAILLLSGAALAAPAAAAVAPELPDAVVDLRTVAGLALVEGEWRYREARIVETDHRFPGPDLRPSGPPNRTWDLEPRADAADFEVSGWEAVAADTLEARRSGGRLSAGWYRLDLTLPARLGDLEVEGSTVVFEIVVDDYAEVWVDGRLPVVLGQSGGPLVAGFNAPNRVVLTTDARPGQRHRVAVLGVNGPLSAPPGNYVWVRSATLDLYRPGRWAAAQPVPTEIERRDPAAARLLPAELVIERLASGFIFTEGPVWVEEGGYLLFSDPNRNVVYRFDPVAGETSIYRTKSGYAGADMALYRQPGSNGLAVDPQGRLILAEHGNRRITRLERNGTLTVLADRYQGRRLNSPNDVVLRSDGALVFSDPPFGLPRFHDDERRELEITGVYCLRDGELSLVTDELAGPNGVAFSPDERSLYVANWDPGRKVLMRYELGADCSVGGRAELFDMTAAPGEEALDGVEVDAEGNLWVSGPGGLWLLSADGRHLATVRGPELPANMAWGDADRRTLYLTARSGLYRLRLPVGGPARAGAAPAPAGPAGGPRVVRLDPRFDELAPPGVTVERVADGFTWVEGPAWDPRSGELLFSDIPRNAVYAWRPGAGTRLFLERSGYSGARPFGGREPGSNGLAFDPRGRLVLCEHGNRRISRLEPDGSRTVLVDRYQGRRLNSPNDLLFTAAGDLLFTDPPFGLPGGFDDPERELPFSGVYRLATDGTLTLLTDALPAPNGLALSPDGRTLYVSNADRERAVWMAFPVLSEGGLGEGRLFFDGTAFAAAAPGAPDGLEADRDGNLFAAGPGGVFVFTPDGAHLGSFELGVPTSNVGWGEDGSVLFVTADTAVYRVALATRGAGY